MPLVNINIRPDDRVASTPVYINGVGRRIPHGKNVEVSDEELKVLQQATGIDVHEVTDKQAAAEAKPAFDTIGSPLGGLVGEPATPAATSVGEDIKPQPEGGSPAIPDLDTGEPVDALDHDANGKKGGAKKPAKSKG